MTSFTDGEPESEDSGHADAPSGRGRGRRNRLWRRHDQDAPAVGELEPDEIQELLRRSHTAAVLDAGSEAHPSAPALHDPDGLVPEDPDNIAARVAHRAHPIAEPAPGTDDVDWGSLVSPAALTGTDADDLEPPVVPADPAQGAHSGTADWADVIDRAVGRRIADLPVEETVDIEAVATGRGLSERLERLRVDSPADESAAITDDEPVDEPAAVPPAQPVDEEPIDPNDWSAIISRATRRPTIDPLTDPLEPTPETLPLGILDEQATAPGEPDVEAEVPAEVAAEVPAEVVEEAVEAEVVAEPVIDFLSPETAFEDPAEAA
ncbi:hypothetical protein ACFQRR_21985, partial [Nocardioides sp. GCM10030258]